MARALAELAEDTMAYLRPSPMFEPQPAAGCIHVFGRDVLWVTRVRRVDLEGARAAARARGVPRIEWWLGPSSPSGAATELVVAGLAPGEPPTLVGMTCDTAPPIVQGVEVRRAGVAEFAELERAVWGGETRPAHAEHPSIHLLAALVDGRLAGVARAVDMDDGVALMGGAVLSELRGRGAYRALVRARWDLAFARGTPRLVVQAGERSAPILSALGFATHCTVRVYADRQ